VALHQVKLANLFKKLTAHVEPFFPIPPVNTVTKLRYMTMTAITTVNSPIKYRNSIYSKNGICNEKKTKNQKYKRKLKKHKIGNNKLQAKSHV
jgi:hypothetical protein